MVGTLSKFAGAAAVMAVLITPTAAIASSTPAPVSAPAAQSAATNWSALSVMSSASSSSVSTAAVQYNDPEDRGGVGGIPLPVLAVWALTLGVFIWILTHDDDDGLDFVSNSPS